MKRIREVLKQLQVARCPEDVFGMHTGSIEKIKNNARAIFRRLAKAVFPDLYRAPEERRMAEETMKLLNALWEEAQEKIQLGTYGNRSVAAPKRRPPIGIKFRTNKYRYTVFDRVRSGGTAGIFEGVVESRGGVVAQVLLKVPHSATDNDLMEREANALQAMQKKLSVLASDLAMKKIADTFASRVPRLLESFKLQEPSVLERKVGNAFVRECGRETGWYTLEEIRKYHPDGVPTRVMTFIWNRTLEGLTLAHAAGVVHGALTPNHILIHAKDHLGMIVDWTASCHTGAREKVPYLDSQYWEFFPEEIAVEGSPPSPRSDIFMSAWNMVYILGGSPKERSIPESIEEPIQALLNRCLQPKPSRRPQNVESVYQEFRQITKSLWGPRKFVELAMPT